MYHQRCPKDCENQKWKNHISIFWHWSIHYAHYIWTIGHYFGFCGQNLGPILELGYFFRFRELRVEVFILSISRTLFMVRKIATIWVSATILPISITLTFLRYQYFIRKIQWWNYSFNIVYCKDRVGDNYLSLIKIISNYNTKIMIVGARIIQKKNHILILCTGSIGILQYYVNYIM